MFRRERRRTALFLALLLGALVAPTGTFAAAADSGMSADLEGKPIQLREVGRYHCEDVDYPRIHCFRSEAARDAAALPQLAAAGTTYVIVWDFTTYAGASLIISQDYNALVTLGWNDRISSYKAQNSQTGKFWTDWFYQGTRYDFCCNQQVPGLGSFDNTFSSVFRV